MKGDATCHTTNAKFRQNYDDIDWKPVPPEDGTCAWIRCRLPIKPRDGFYQSQDGRRWHGACLDQYERLSGDKLHWFVPVRYMKDRFALDTYRA